MPGGIAAAIRDAGVVGAGGAGFPAHIKAASRVSCVIVNGAECEPLLRVDQQLLDSRAVDVLKGLSVLLDATGAGRGVVALKSKYARAVKQLSGNITDSRMELFLLEDFYPAGDEHVLVREITGKPVPEGGIPLDAGCVVNNVETVINVAAAVERKAVVDTWLTVTGHVSEPFTCRAPVGTPMREVLALAGIKEAPELALLEGGPMTGRLISEWDTPVTKTTKGLILLPGNHPLITARRLPLEVALRRARSVCMLCARCSDICPRRLLGHDIRPHMIMRAVAYARQDAAPIRSALLCSECGACEYACPMGLSPRKISAGLKKELGAAGISCRGGGKDPEASKMMDCRKIPAKRLVSRLGIKEYDRPAPLNEAGIRISRVSIPLRQHVGAPCRSLVKVGDLVQRGQPVGEIPKGKLGARVHASIDGSVVEQDDARVVIEAVE